MYISRVIENTIKKFSNEFSVIVVTGARQVGKSTLLQMIKEDDMNYVTLDDLDARTLAKTDPKYFLEQYGYPLIIDEIQYAPNLLPYIKIIVDEYRLKSLKNNTKQKALFWLTGSQQFRLMKDVSESLAGRIGVLNLYSLSNSEINKSNVGLFSPKLDVLKEKQKNSIEKKGNVFERIFNGGMPTVVSNIAERNNYFSSYVNIAKEIGVDSKTIKSWISILEASGIIYLLQPYYSNASNRIIKAPKLYFMDTGLCSYLAKYPNPETLEVGALSRAIFETFVVSEIIKNFSNYGIDPKINLYYYRDKDQKEVDLVYVEGNTLYPIEIKKGISPNNPDKNFSVLKKYSDDVRPGIVICLTQKLQPINKDCWLCPVNLI